MSVIVSTSEQIGKSPLNTSPSKHQFSFSKAPRFKFVKTSDGKIGYTLPSTLHKRTTSFGYGRRTQFQRKQRNPSPDAYMINSSFQQKARGSRGFSFGASRQCYDSVYFREAPRRDPRMPGPGQYYSQWGRIGSTGQQFTMRPKTSMSRLCTDSGAQRPGNDSPGPGVYNPNDFIPQNGKYVLSKYQNCLSASFFTAKETVSKKKAFLEPGPGQYDPNDSLDPVGSYYISKFKSTQCRSFTHSKRGLEMRRASVSVLTPGPGQYRLPSDFGYYEAKPGSNRAANKSFSNLYKDTACSTKAATSFRQLVSQGNEGVASLPSLRTESKVKAIKQ